MRERTQKHEEDIFSLPVLLPQMPQTARDGPGAKNCNWVSSWAAGDQRLDLSSAAFPGTPAGSCIKSRAART